MTSAYRPILIQSLALFFFTSVSGQNIVDISSLTFTANPAKLTGMDFSEFFVSTPDYSKKPPETERIRRKLNQHVGEFVKGWPWKPFQTTLGISGHETYFGHPDELFYVLSMALPYLNEANRAAVRELLKDQLKEHPPFAVEGYDRRLGNAREAYLVPDPLRLSGKVKATSLFGVYAFWLYCHATGDEMVARDLWTAVEERVKPLLAQKEYAFDIRKPHSKDEARKLNGDLAGLIGYLRLAKLGGKPADFEKASQTALTLLELRVNLERVNPNFLESTASSTKTLHHQKLARYCSVVPEIGRALRKHSDGVAEARLKHFREERNGWFMAFGERLVGGENYISPPHLSSALFAGGALIEELPAEELAKFLDVPWCKGDLYFIEKCVLQLWAEAGRPWMKLQ